ncbi:MAG TPA: flagellar biosynthesis protein FliQ [Anaerolineae bacterium]|nr:flagellar biosynthesis protein FliQ [Anaerolineae bacterium]HMR64075.1 flagellar biosynthesis protein FliQ [Anaerolineae bacterium]
MTESFIMTLGRDALMITLLVGAPMLAVSLVIGLLVSLFQAVTQINEMTLTFVPKILGMTLILALTGPWMLEQIIYFTARLFDMLPQMVQ